VNEEITARLLAEIQQALCQIGDSADLVDPEVASKIRSQIREISWRSETLARNVNENPLYVSREQVRDLVSWHGVEIDGDDYVKIRHLECLCP